MATGLEDGDSYPPPVLAEVVRSGFIEGAHRGALVVLGADGVRTLSRGPVGEPMFPRSAHKPAQAVGLLDAGLDAIVGTDERLLAVVCASHSGTREHVALVRRLLAAAGLDESALDNSEGLPLDPVAAEALIRSGGGPDRLQQNCSGKHAGMVAASAAAGWPVRGYRDPDHPVQLMIRAAVERVTGEPVAAVAVDGCGAPLFGCTLAGLARAFGRLVMAPAGTAERQVADAMRAHPEVVGGPGRPVTELMAAHPGLLAKDGAEGVFAAALPDGRAVAVKICDGAARAAVPVLVAALRGLGLGSGVLDRLAETPVLGHGEPVGSVRPVTSVV